MGMLQLAGMVSGFGKGVGRGLENMQNTMSSMQLLEIRNEMDRARQRETWGHEEGVIQRQHKWDEARDDKKFSRDLDLKDQDQDFRAQQDRITREEGRQKEGRDAERQKEQDEVRYQHEISKLVVEKGLSQQEAARKVAEDRAKEERDRKEKRQERQETTGKEIVLESMRGQNRAHTGPAGRIDPQVKLQYTAISDKIERLAKESESLTLKDEERKAKLRQIEALEAQRDAISGLPSTQRERPGYKFPD